MVYKMTPRYLDKNILNSLKNECESVRNILELYFYTVTGSYSGQTAVNDSWEMLWDIAGYIKYYMDLVWYCKCTILYDLNNK